MKGWIKILKKVIDNSTFFIYNIFTFSNYSMIFFEKLNQILESKYFNRKF